jgi:hypothetical protein
LPSPDFFLPFKEHLHSLKCVPYFICLSFGVQSREK